MKTETTLNCICVPADTVEIHKDGDETVLNTNRGAACGRDVERGQPIRVKIKDLLAALGVTPAEAAPVSKERARPRGPQQYRGSGNHFWEPVTQEGAHQGDSVRRLRVPGGWLYECPTGTVFVAMPEAVGYHI